MAKSVFLNVEGQVYGPYSPKQIREYVAEGRVIPTSILKLGEEGKWVEARRVKGLFNDQQQPIRKASAADQSTATPETPRSPVLKPLHTSQTPQQNPADASPIPFRSFADTATGNANAGQPSQTPAIPVAQSVDSPQPIDNPIRVAEQSNAPPQGPPIRVVQPQPVKVATEPTPSQPVGHEFPNVMTKKDVPRHEQRKTDAELPDDEEPPWFIFLGGLFLIGCGVGLYFWFDYAERNGGGRMRLPAIVWMLYIWLGKLGVLGVLGGLGTFGVIMGLKDMLNGK